MSLSYIIITYYIYIYILYNILLRPVFSSFVRLRTGATWRSPSHFVLSSGISLQVQFHDNITGRCSATESKELCLICTLFCTFRCSWVGTVHRRYSFALPNVGSTVWLWTFNIGGQPDSTRSWKINRLLHLMFRQFHFL